MRDTDIRKALNCSIRANAHGDPHTRVIQEMPLCGGRSRVDVAVINGEFAGIEIKSERDTLARLPAQMRLYSSVFDRVTVVVADCHLRDTYRMVPDWWGVEVATKSESIEFETLRTSAYNEDVQADAIVQLLWREEAMAILAQAGLEHGCKSKPKRFLWRRLTETHSTGELRDLVRRTLKSRQMWRVG